MCVCVWRQRFFHIETNVNIRRHIETKRNKNDTAQQCTERGREKGTAGTKLYLLKVLCTHAHTFYTHSQSQSLSTFETVSKTNVVCCVCMGNNTNCPRRRRATKKRELTESRKTKHEKKSNNNFCVDLFFVSFVCIVTELSCKSKLGERNSLIFCANLDWKLQCLDKLVPQ